MPRGKKVLPLLFLLGGSAGCARVQAYHPAPIVPAVTARRLESRRLSDPGLQRYMEQALGHPVAWPPREWNLGTLTLAALYFHPQMRIARERAAVAQAAIVTAGERPNPSISLTPGIPSPWLFDMPISFPIETAGKRGLRIEQARDLSFAAKAGLAQTAWQVASGLRKALLAYEIARANLALRRSTERLEASRVTLLTNLLTAGEGARPALQTAQLALSNTRFTRRVAEGQVATTRAALSSAIGVPVEALEGVSLTWPSIDRLPPLAALSPAGIERDAVLNRLDVRQALENYAAADAALRLQLARQYPNFNIGPGYDFEEGNNFFTIPFSLVLPLLNRNQGPIAQAEALRKEAAANFLAVQARAIAQSQSALAAYGSALGEFQEAGAPLRDQQAQVRMTQAALREGESDRLQLNALELEGAIYGQQRLQALANAQNALGALEDAVEKPLGPDASILPADASGTPAHGPKELLR